MGIRHTVIMFVAAVVLSVPCSVRACLLGTIDVTEVPEPATILLLGLSSLALLRGRRK